jgi:hypothetical protein
MTIRRSGGKDRRGTASAVVQTVVIDGESEAGSDVAGLVLPRVAEAAVVFGPSWL